jgi:hypothetical protein
LQSSGSYTGSGLTSPVTLAPLNTFKDYMKLLNRLKTLAKSRKAALVAGAVAGAVGGEPAAKCVLDIFSFLSGLL